MSKNNDDETRESHKVRRVLIVGLVLAIVGGLIALVSSSANASITIKQHVSNRIDDNGWARDTFDRTSVITASPSGGYDVVITDNGSFKTVKGQPSPANPSVTVSRSLVGKFTGGGKYHVTGSLKTTSQLNALADSFDDSAGTQVSTGNWAKQFFKSGATDTGITGWKWTYITADEQMVQQDGQPIVGNITGKLSSKLTVAGVCRTAASAKWKVANGQGDRSRPFTYWTYNKGWSKAKTGTVNAGYSVTVTSPKATSISVHYYDGYGNKRAAYAKVATKTC